MNINILSRHSLSDCLGRYTEWLATTRRYAERSKREYRDDATHVIQYLEERCHIRSVRMVQRRHLTGFLGHCSALGHAASTRRRSVAAIRSFFAFLVKEGVIRYSPAEDLLPPERETRPPRVLTEDEYTRLRDAASDHPRDAALIELALQTGLRLSEIARLKTSDIVLPPRSTETVIGHVRVAGRAGRSRTVTLNTQACATLRAYLGEREPSDSPALFLTKFDRGIGPRGIENIMTKYCKEAGISHASVHSLRHTMAVQMLRHGASPAIVGTALGHASPETTSIYVELARGDGRRDATRSLLIPPCREMLYSLYALCHREENPSLMSRECPERSPSPTVSARGTGRAGRARPMRPSPKEYGVSRQLVHAILTRPAPLSRRRRRAMQPFVARFPVEQLEKCRWEARGDGKPLGIWLREVIVGYLDRPSAE